MAKPPGDADPAASRLALAQIRGALRGLPPDTAAGILAAAFADQMRKVPLADRGDFARTAGQLVHVALQN